MNIVAVVEEGVRQTPQVLDELGVLVVPLVEEGEGEVAGLALVVPVVLGHGENVEYGSGEHEYLSLPKHGYCGVDSQTLAD